MTLEKSQAFVQRHTNDRLSIAHFFFFTSFNGDGIRAIPELLGIKEKLVEAEKVPRIVQDGPRGPERRQGLEPKTNSSPPSFCLVSP